jgi:hypothetical protein
VSGKTAALLVRILNNNGRLLKVAGLSPDPAITADPISIERIELPRQPWALQY